MGRKVEDWKQGIRIPFRFQKNIMTGQYCSERGRTLAVTWKGLLPTMFLSMQGRHCDPRAFLPSFQKSKEWNQPSNFFPFFFLNRGSHYAPRNGPKLLSSNDPPASVCPVAKKQTWNPAPDFQHFTSWRGMVTTKVQKESLQLLTSHGYSIHNQQSSRQIKLEER